MNFLQQIVKSKHFKKIIIMAFFAISGGAWLGVWIYGHYYASTDDAYINANVVQIAPRITGKIINLHIVNNQYVKKGQALFDIDPEPFQVAVASAEAQIAMSQAQLAKASISAKRTMQLLKNKYASPQDGDNAVASLKTAEASLATAQAALTQALLNLQYTKITAPVSGWVTNVTLRAGNIVAANQPLFALISDEEFWADSNFKETEMEGIKPGQLATIVTDLYPKHQFKGIVDSIGGAAGAAFSLLPPQNATGNWVKVTQRVPIRVRILDPDPQFPLRVGISATVTVKLHNDSKNTTSS